MLISVIIPVYNAAKYLDECICSLQNQTLTDFQFIFVNDGSTDDSLEIIERYAKLDKRIEIISKKNGGVSSARNAGLDIVRGEFIGWVDADDFIEPDMFEFLINNALKYKADISECGHSSIQNNYINEAKFGNKFEFGNHDFMLQKYLELDIYYGLWSKLFKREIFDNVRFPEGRIWEDIWLVTKVCFANYSYVRDPIVKYFYRQTPDSIIRSGISERKARESIYILENTMNLIRESKLDNSIKERLITLNMEKAVFWYLDLALSENIKLRNIYSKAYFKRMNYSVFKSLFSKVLNYRNKLSYLICCMGLNSQLFYIKNYLKSHETSTAKKL